MALNCLILDDDSARHKKLAQYLRELFGTAAAIFVASDLRTFLFQFSNWGDWDIILLDRDLHYEVPRQFVTVGGKRHTASGEDAAKAIIDAPFEQRPKLVFVHSLNRSRAPVMVKMLRDAGIPVVRRPYTAEGLLEWLQGTEA